MHRTVSHGGAPGDRGFTLLEIVAALFILAVSLLAMANMQIRAIQAGDYSGDISTASALAQDRIEQLQTAPFDSIATGTDPSPPEGYTISWTVDDATWANAKGIAVTVSWRGGHVTLRSLIAP